MQILPRSLRILRGSYQDLQGSSMFLPKIFKGPLWILPRSLKIVKDLWRSFADFTKVFKDLQRSLMTLCRSYQDLWGSSRILYWSCQDLEDPQLPCKCPKVGGRGYPGNSARAKASSQWYSTTGILTNPIVLIKIGAWVM